MTDPKAWQFFNQIALTCEHLRQQAGLNGKEHVHPSRYGGVAMLAYHLRQAHNQAVELAGKKPDGVDLDEESKG